MHLGIRPTTTLFDDKHVQMILDNALLLLEKTPFTVQGPDEFLDLLRAFGCPVDGGKVSFPTPVVDKVLARCELERHRYQARRRDDTVAEPEAVSVYTHGQALHICDPETNALRDATAADLAEWCHLVEALGITSRTHPTFIPADGPIATADIRALVTVLLNSSQPHCVSVYSAAMLPYFIEAMTVIKGSLEAVKADPVFDSKAWVTSPFKLDRENIDIAMEARRLLSLPVQFGQMPVAGASTPITVAGALTQNTAEALAISAMRLAIDDLPQPIAPTSAILDMRHGVPRQIGPDLLLHHIAGREMDDFLYRGERCHGAWGWCGAGAATVGSQSILEKAMGFGMATAMGARSFGVGCLGFGDVGSPVQLVIDLELAGVAQTLLQNVPLDDDHIGMDPMMQIAPAGGRYLETMHTAQFFRESCWLPGLCDFRVAQAWANNPQDVVAKARDKVLQVKRQAENPCSLSAEQQAHIRRILADAERRAQE